MNTSIDTFDAAQVHIWQIDDMEWWIGTGTRDQIRDALIEEYGEAFEEGEHSLELVSDDALDTLKFHYSGEDDPDCMLTRSFREQLAIEIAEGVEEPRMFACAEW